MSGRDRDPDDAPEERRGHDDGAMTAADGTPVAVDMSGDRQARSSIAVVLTAPVIWSVHFMLVYLVVDAGCTGEGPGLRLLDPPVPTVVTLAATAMAVLGCLVSAAWGYRRWRVGQRQAAGDDGHGRPRPERPERERPLAFVGFLLSLLGVVAVLFVGLPALVLPAC